MVIKDKCCAGGCSWLDYVCEKTLNSNKGQFFGFDKKGEHIDFEWEGVSAKNSDFGQKFEIVKDVFARAISPDTAKFFKENPAARNSVARYSELLPLFEEGEDFIDWPIVEKKITNLNRKYLVSDAVAACGNESISWFVYAKANDNIVGFAQFLIKPEFKDASIELHYLMVLPEWQRRGFGKLLISSIFKIFGGTEIEIDRIFLVTLQSNKNAVLAYFSYGFEIYKDSNAVIRPGSLDPYMVSLECKGAQIDFLKNAFQKNC